MSSAYDMAIVARELVKFPDVMKWSGTKEAPFRNGTMTLTNTNRLVRETGWVDGLKTGYYREAGFNVTLRPAEFASALTDDDNGKLQAFAIGWSGRLDPDGNIHPFQTCGGSLNTTLACDESIDALLNRAREVGDQGQRAKLYREAIDKFTARRNVIYLYHLNYIVAFPRNVKGYHAVPDGLIRVKGVTWN